MRLVLVPMWMFRVLRQNKLNINKLLEGDDLLPFISKRDLEAYATMNAIAFEQSSQYAGPDVKFGEKMTAIFRTFYKASVRRSSSEPDAYVQDRHGKNASHYHFDSYDRFVEALIGMPMPDGFYLSFNVVSIDVDTVALVANIKQGDPADCYEAHNAVLEKLLEVLYANSSIEEFARTPLLNAYVNTFNVFKATKEG